MFCLIIFALKHNIIVWFEIDLMRQNIKMVSESSDIIGKNNFETHLFAVVYSL